MLIAFRVLLGIGEAIYLPGGSKIVSLLFPPAERGASERPLRRRHAHRPGPRGRAGARGC